MAALRCVSIIRNTIESTTRATTPRQELLQAVAAVRRDLRNGLEAGERRISNDWLGSARAGNRFSGWDHMARPSPNTCSKAEPMESNLIKHLLIAASVPVLLILTAVIADQRPPDLSAIFNGNYH
jgi:hypothetical protein